MVERGQGVAKDWAEPERCGSPEELQERLEAEDRVQRECYPHAGLASRLAAYPGLAHSGRPYDEAWERAQLVLGAVLAHLAGVPVPRRVDSSGKIGLYHEKMYVGTVNSGKEVVVQFDARRPSASTSTPSNLGSDGRAGAARRAGGGGAPRGARSRGRPPPGGGARARPPVRRPGAALAGPRDHELRRRPAHRDRADGLAHERRAGHRPRRDPGRDAAPRCSSTASSTTRPSTRSSTRSSSGRARRRRSPRRAA